MFHLAQMAPAETISDVVDSGRRTLASIDLDSAARSARSAAIEILPNDWFRPKRRRWPFVAGALVLGAFVSVLFLLRGPALQMVAHRQVDREPRLETDIPEIDIQAAPVEMHVL